MIHTQDQDFTLIQADVLDGLRSLPDGSVHCVVTSPPYYALRDYSTNGQIGLESTLDEYVARLVGVFREVRRVMRDDATLWLNLGDSFGDKQMMGVPWRVAFALQADGWYLRSEIIWAKPNPMPESVTDRPTKAHEQVFLLTRSPRYFFDQEAVREPHTPDGRRKTVHDHATDNSHPNYDNVGNGNERWPNSGRNVRSVWDIATQPYPEAHFATYPEELVRRCVLAGTSERGCCPECGKPWEREVERIGIDVPRGNEPHLRRDPGNTLDRDIPTHYKPTITTLGWRPGCNHATDPIACTVLDPFLGSGTTAYVARKHGRRSIGIELNAAYCDLAARRMQQQSLLV